MEIAVATGKQKGKAKERATVKVKERALPKVMEKGQRKRKRKRKRPHNRMLELRRCTLCIGLPRWKIKGQRKGLARLWAGGGRIRLGVDIARRRESSGRSETIVSISNSTTSTNQDSKQFPNPGN